MLGHVRAIARATGLPVRVIRRDIVTRCGPLGGVYTALQTTRKEAVMFLACDAPFVSVALLERLAQKFQAAPEAWFITNQGRAGFPFLLPRWSLAVVAKQLARGELSLQSLAIEVNGKRVGPPRGLSWQLWNVNTPDDWERARRLWRNLRATASVGPAGPKRFSARRTKQLTESRRGRGRPRSVLAGKKRL